MKKWSIIALILVVALLVLPACKTETATPAPAAKATAAPAAKPATAPAAAAPAQPTPTPAAAAKPKIEATTAPSAPAAGAKIVPTPIPGVKMPDFLRFYGGASPGVVSDIIGKVVLRYLNDTFPQMKTRLLPAGLFEATVNVEIGEGDLAVGVTSGMADLVNGKNEVYLNKKMTNIRHLVTFPTYTAGNLIVLRDSPIKDISELKGKKVNFGPITSSARFAAWSIFNAYGITEENNKAAGGSVSYLSWDPSIDMLAEGKLDAILVWYKHPAARLTTLNAVRGVRFLKFSDAALKRASEENQLDIGLVAANTYKDQTEAVPTMLATHNLLTSKNLPADVVFNIMAAVYKDNGKSFIEANSQWADTDWAGIPVKKELVIVPVHPGAVNYWKARGFTIPDPVVKIN